jgi:hypothetical protein
MSVKFTMVDVETGICMKVVRGDGQELSLFFGNETTWNGHKAYTFEEARTYPRTMSSSRFTLLSPMDDEGVIDTINGFIKEG